MGVVYLAGYVMGELGVQEDVASVWGNHARQLCLQGISSVCGG